MAGVHTQLGRAPDDLAIGKVELLRRQNGNIFLDVWGEGRQGRIGRLPHLGVEGQVSLADALVAGQLFVVVLLPLGQGHARGGLFRLGWWCLFGGFGRGGLLQCGPKALPGLHQRQLAGEQVGVDASPTAGAGSSDDYRPNRCRAG